MILIKVSYKNIRSIEVEKFNIFALFCVAALIVTYIIVVNGVAIENYKKTALQKHIDSLRMEIKTLNLELADKRSIGFLKKAAERLNLVVGENIQYIKITGPVAKNP